MSTSTMNFRIREAPQIPSFFDSLPVSFHAGFCGGINLFNFISTLLGALVPFVSRNLTVGNGWTEAWYANLRVRQ